MTNPSIRDYIAELHERIRTAEIAAEMDTERYHCECQMRCDDRWSRMLAETAIMRAALDKAIENEAAILSQCEHPILPEGE